MPLLPFRCINPECSTVTNGGSPKFDFDAEEPVCPKCGSDARTDMGRMRVCALAVIHYLRIDPAGNIRTPAGPRSLACNPEAKALPTRRVKDSRGRWQNESFATGEPESVTCPACKASTIFKFEQEMGHIHHMEIIPPPS